MSKKNNSVKISDLRNISRVLKKVRERGSKLKFTKIAPKEDLIIVCMETPLSSWRKKLLVEFQANSSMTRAAPIY